MTIERFEQLTTTAQADYLLQSGSFLQTYQHKNVSVDVYELEDLFVEISYSQEAEDLLSIRIYTMQAYLRQLGGHLQPKLIIRNSSTSIHQQAA